MKWNAFPPRVRELERFSERFDAFRLRAEGCDVLFATYPAGTRIEPHRHDTANWGVVTKGRVVIAMDGTERSYGTGEWYHVPARAEHAAHCDVDTETIEFWFAAQ